MSFERSLFGSTSIEDSDESDTILVSEPTEHKQNSFPQPPNRSHLDPLHASSIPANMCD